MVEVRAKLRSAKVASQKARLVADQIRGKQVEQALDILTHDLHKSSHIVKKVLESAIANSHTEHQNWVLNVAHLQLEVASEIFESA